MATLNTVIAIFAGHDLPETGQPVEFMGTVGAFVAANEDAMDGDAVQALLDDLDAQGRHLIGGGAAACFLVLKVTPEPAYARVTRGAGLTPAAPTVH